MRKEAKCFERISVVHVGNQGMNLYKGHSCDNKRILLIKVPNRKKNSHFPISDKKQKSSTDRRPILLTI